MIKVSIFSRQKRKMRPDSGKIRNRTSGIRSNSKKHYPALSFIKLCAYRKVLAPAVPRYKRKITFYIIWIITTNLHYSKKRHKHILVSMQSIYWLSGLAQHKQVFVFILLYNIQLHIPGFTILQKFHKKKIANDI